MSIGVLVPTYKRGLRQMQEVTDSFTQTYNGISDLIFVVEPNDLVSQQPLRFAAHTRTHVLKEHSSGGMQPALNAAAIDYFDKYAILGFIGDDHRFRSPKWDDAIMIAFKDPTVAFVYGPDGSDNVRLELPTWWFMRASVAKALGWMALPACRHFFLDDAIRDLGKETQSLKYLPDVMIEHLHFSLGKSKQDETYNHTMRVGSGDEYRYHDWRFGKEFDEDVKKVRDALRKS